MKTTAYQIQYRYCAQENWLRWPCDATNLKERKKKIKHLRHGWDYQFRIVKIVTCVTVIKERGGK